LLTKFHLLEKIAICLGFLSALNTSKRRYTLWWS